MVLKAETQFYIANLLATVTRSPHSLLLLDYDGTLAPFREKRDQARPYPGIALLLSEIVASGHTRLVIVSGRDANEMVPLLGMVPTPEVWGLHGLQRRMPDGSVRVVKIEKRKNDALHAADEWLTQENLRQTAEFKTGSIALHWRGLDESRTEDIRHRVLTGWRPIAEEHRLELMEFDGGVELRVPDVDKGDAVRLVLGEMEPDTPAAYLGDDITDESAFQAIAGRGLSVLVRSRWRPTAARVWLRPPEEVVEFLVQWRKAVRAASERKNDQKGEPASAEMTQ